MTKGMIVSLAIVMPVWIQNDDLLKMTLQSLSSIHHDESHSIKIFVVTTRLHGITPDDFSLKCHKACCFDLEVLHDPGVDRSVAGAWNHGCRKALKWGADHMCIMANDVLLDHDCLDHLLSNFDDLQREGFDLVSGVGRFVPSVFKVIHCDFSCIMFSPATLERHGWFDQEYRPAYFEDNDYVARVVLGGHEFCALAGARFFHFGSATTKMDAEAAHHVNHWFGINKQRFVNKWGCSPLNQPHEMLELYHKHPFNNSDLQLKDW